MCGRVIQSSGPLHYAIVDGLNVRDSRVHNYPPRWNAAPSQELLVIRRNHKTGEVSLDPLRWGLIPYWCKDPTGGRKPINAKCETVSTLPTFREGATPEERAPTQTACGNAGCATDDPTVTTVPQEGGCISTGCGATTERPKTQVAAHPPSELKAALKELAAATARALKPVRGDVAVGCVTPNCAKPGPTESKLPQGCSGGSC
jgi:SOS response associated peptidase (SRAP)